MAVFHASPGQNKPTPQI